jgi:hypothetical protein
MKNAKNDIFFKIHLLDSFDQEETDSCGEMRQITEEAEKTFYTLYTKSKINDHSLHMCSPEASEIGNEELEAAAVTNSQARIFNVWLFLDSNTPKELSEAHESENCGNINDSNTDILPCDASSIPTLRDFLSNSAQNSQTYEVPLSYGTLIDNGTPYEYNQPPPQYQHPQQIRYTSMAPPYQYHSGYYYNQQPNYQGFNSFPHNVNNYEYGYHQSMIPQVVPPQYQQQYPTQFPPPQPSEPVQLPQREKKILSFVDPKTKKRYTPVKNHVCTPLENITPSDKPRDRRVKNKFSNLKSN